MPTGSRRQPTSVSDLPPLTGSALLDPWRIRHRLHLAGELQPATRGGPTASELKLWQALEANASGWIREYTTGPYRLDFYLPSSGLAVEVDGPSHWGQTRAVADEHRDAWHRHRGIRTLRVSDRDVLRDLPGVLYLISREIEVRDLVRDSGESQQLAPANEVADLVDAAVVVEVAIARLAAACVTVLPVWPASRGFFRFVG